MDHQPASLVTIPVNGAHDLLARLYREIGVSAVAAALAPPAPVLAQERSGTARIVAATSKAA